MQHEENLVGYSGFASVDDAAAARDDKRSSSSDDDDLACRLISFMMSSMSGRSLTETSAPAPAPAPAPVAGGGAVDESAIFLRAVATNFQAGKKVSA